MQQKCRFIVRLTARKPDEKREKKEEEQNMCDCHMCLVLVCRWRTDVKFNSFKGAKWTLTLGPGVFQIKSYK